MKPAIDIVSAGLSDEIQSGKAEVSRQQHDREHHGGGALYIPGSYTFSNESRDLRSKLATLLKR